MNHKPSGPRVLAPIAAALVGASVALLLAGCGGDTAKTGSAKTTNTATQASVPAWQSGTTPPKVTPALLARAGYGLTAAHATLGIVDEVFGAVPADVHVNPSAKQLNDEYARFGRCMGEQLKIHDVGHELALLVAYNRKDRAVQAAVEKASSVCEGFAITPDANYKQSLMTNP
jgi:hypothetical protein